ncbi:MAG TPA: iron-containing alcohol dehydrogenase [Pirellulaceae bacterium]|nr:iron-containing alcohol dehydrogenase [Pirellulaceae bacterium]
MKFEMQLRTRVVFGPDEIDRLGALAAELRCVRALVVTDPGIVAVGHVERGVESLRRQGFEVEMFDGARENPNTQHVAHGVDVARDFQPDILVGLGGGSSLDCAKGINFIYTNGGRMQDYWGVGKATRPMLPMIAVPTTAGTGSEMQSFALISDAETRAKMACGDPKATCAMAVLDPKLTITQPDWVTAVTGIDAISHAVETYVSKRRTPVSQIFSREAWRLLANHFGRVLTDPRDLTARAAMQWGAALAGLAIENSMLGAAHSLANPITARHGTVHGQAVAVSLPHVVRFNGAAFNQWYVELLAASAGEGITPPPESGAEGLSQFINQLVQQAGLKTTWSGCGVSLDDVESLADEAARQWTAQFNPRDVGQGELKWLYQQAS